MHMMATKTNKVQPTKLNIQLAQNQNKPRIKTSAHTIEIIFIFHTMPSPTQPELNAGNMA